MTAVEADPWFNEPDQPWPTFTNVRIIKSGPHTTWTMQVGTWADGEPRVISVPERDVRSQSNLSSMCCERYTFVEMPDDQWQQKVDAAKASAEVIKKAKRKRIVGRRPTRLRIPPAELLAMRSRLKSHAANDASLMDGIRSYLASASAVGDIFGKLRRHMPHLDADGVVFTRRGLRAHLRAAGVRCNRDKFAEALDVVGARGVFWNVKNRKGVRAMVVHKTD